MNEIDRLRKLKNLTQKELSGKIGKSREWYSQAVIRNNLSVEDLINIAEVFEISPCELFSAEQRKKEEKKESRYEYLEMQIKHQSEIIEVMKSLIETLKKESNK